MNDVKDIRNSHGIRYNIFAYKLLGGSFFVITIMLIFQFALIYDGFNARKWIITEGQIVHSMIKQYNDGIVPEIKYEYHVEGKKYESNRIHVGQPKIMSLELYELFREKKNITVYYNPKEPEQSLLLVRLFPIRLDLVLYLIGALIAAMYLLFYEKVKAPIVISIGIVFGLIVGFWNV